MIGAPETRASAAAIVGNAVRTPKNMRLHVVELVRSRSEIHHESDHLVAAERGEHAARRAFGRKDDDVLVLAVRDEEVHQPRVLELVGHDGQRDLLRDARAADLEVPVVRGDEDDPAAVFARRRAGARAKHVDRHELVQLGRGPSTGSA